MKGGLGQREVFKIPDDKYAPYSTKLILGYRREGLSILQKGSWREPEPGPVPGEWSARKPLRLTQLKPGDAVTIDAAAEGVMEIPWIVILKW
jgi:hypothetical protein